MTAPDAPRVVEGRLFDCPEDLVLAADCLGQTYQTVIGQQALEVSVPTVADSTNPGEIEKLVAPPRYYDFVPLTGDWGFVDEGHIEHGPKSALVKMFHYRYTFAGSDEALVATCKKIDDALYGWWTRVAMWLDTYTELDLLGKRNSRPIVMGKRHSVYTQHSDGSVWRPSWNTSRVMQVGKSLEVPDSTTLGLCLSLAGRNVSPPAEWQYLREAQSWLSAGQTRRAVIDACTAAEIALEDQVRQLLHDSPKVVIEQLLTRCSGIAEKARLVADLGGENASSRRIADQLAGVRNSAAHAGDEPEPGKAHQAVALAVEIVDRVRPRETLHEAQAES
ncbi:hypothetical protein [Nocardia fluminea]|uniref:hypothetical protein n=1 Tax=Nocardia fluminea TaxID=134984 RepID=UPI003D13B20E